MIDARSASKRRRRGELPPKITVSPETFVDTLPVPKTYEEAITGPYRDYWIKAIADELDNLRNYGVWKVQRLPKNVRPVKGKFVFRWKPNAANTLDKPKARFTLKGYSQKKGIHYKKTYASVAAIMTIFLTCIVSVKLDYACHQSDLKAAYLTAPIEPDIELFMDPPPGVEVPDGYSMRVVKAIYGSMQGAERLDVYKDTKLTELGFIRSCAEPSLYFMSQDSPKSSADNSRGRFSDSLQR